jgi:predicted AAA+ superfamily ATPase
MDILPADHPVFKPDMIPTDFGAFSNFNIAKHSYWEKTPEEINTYLTTGQFPEAINANASAAPAPAMTIFMAV